MLSTALKEISGLRGVPGLFDPRVWGTAIIPVLAVSVLSASAALGLLAFEHGWGWVDAQWAALGTVGQAVVGAASALAVVLGALLTAQFQFSFIRFWEGYPAESWATRVVLRPTRPAFALGRVLARSSRDRRCRHFARLQRLAVEEDNAAEMERALLGPPPAHVAALDVVARVNTFLANTYRRAMTLFDAYAIPVVAHPAILAALRRWGRSGRDGDWQLIEAADQGRALLAEARAAQNPAAPDAALDAACLELVGLLRGLAVEAAARTRRHADRLARLFEAGYQYEPPDDEAPLPTRLGQAVRAAEAYPQSRYGADAVLVWPRLAPLLPAEFAKGFADAEGGLIVSTTLLTLLLFIGLPVAVAAAVVLAGSPGVPVNAWGALAVLAAPLAVVLLAGALYQAAVNAACGYGDQIRAAFDLHRGAVLKQMGYRPPPSADDERETWRQLTHWLLLGYPPGPSGHLDYADRATRYPPPIVLRATAALASGHPLAAADVVADAGTPIDVPAGAYDSAALVVGRTTVRAVARDEIIAVGALLANPRIVPVAVPGAAVTSRILKPGAWVDVSAVVTVATNPPAAMTVAPLEVLAVHPPAEAGGAGTIFVAVADASVAALALVLSAERYTVFCRA